MLHAGYYATGDEVECLGEIEPDPEDCAEETWRVLFDTKPPEITAPPDIRIVAEEAPLFLDIGKPEVSDMTDPSPVVTNDAPKDLAFPFGTTVITWEAVDVKGNSAVDYQFVTVIEHSSPTLPFEQIAPEKSMPFRSSAKSYLLEIDPIPNSVPSGSKVVITGKLIDAHTGEGMQAVDVSFLDNRPLDIRTIGKAKTDDEGNFNFVMYAGPAVRGNDRLMSILAKFDGNGVYEPAVSHERSLMVDVEKLTIDLAYRKQNFGSGERVIMFAAVKAFGDTPIDPDKLRAWFDGVEVAQIIKKETGIYQFTSLANSKQMPHSFTIQAVKFPSGDQSFDSALEWILIK